MHKRNQQDFLWTLYMSFFFLNLEAFTYLDSTFFFISTFKEVCGCILSVSLDLSLVVCLFTIQQRERETHSLRQGEGGILLQTPSRGPQCRGLRISKHHCTPQQYDLTRFLFTRLTVMSIQLSEAHKHMAHSQERLLRLGGGRDRKWGKSKEGVGSREDHLK